MATRAGFAGLARDHTCVTQRSDAIQISLGYITRAGASLGYRGGLDRCYYLKQFAIEMATNLVRNTG
jgi:hypothetical protein